MDRTDEVLNTTSFHELGLGTEGHLRDKAVVLSCTLHGSPAGLTSGGGEQPEAGDEGAKGM